LGMPITLQSNVNKGSRETVGGTFGKKMDHPHLRELRNHEKQIWEGRTLGTRNNPRKIKENRGVAKTENTKTTGHRKRENYK